MSRRQSTLKAIWPIVALAVAIAILALCWAALWHRDGIIRDMEAEIAGLKGDVAEAKGELQDAQAELAEMKETPLEYLLLYRRATIARFERTEPRWDRIMEAAWRSSKKHGVPPEITVAKIEHESFFNPDAIGPVGEIGLMQIYPAAWPQFDQARGLDIEYNTDFGCRVFAGCLKAAKGNVRDALVLYNGRGPLPEGMLPYPDRVLNGRSLKKTFPLKGEK
jgi:soluble lytic murein transglycosylase-like protein